MFLYEMEGGLKWVNLNSRSNKVEKLFKKKLGGRAVFFFKLLLSVNLGLLKHDKIQNYREVFRRTLTNI